MSNKKKKAPAKKAPVNQQATANNSDVMHQLLDAKIEIPLGLLRQKHIFIATPCYGGQIGEPYFRSMMRGNSFCAYVDTQENKTLLLDYQLNTMYLFNTQVLHAVFNFEEDRYMFTVEFEDTRQLLPYRALVKRLSKESIL